MEFVLEVFSAWLEDGNLQKWGWILPIAIGGVIELNEKKLPRIIFMFGNIFSLIGMLWALAVFVLWLSTFNYSALIAYFLTSVQTRDFWAKWAGVPLLLFAIALASINQNNATVLKFARLLAIGSLASLFFNLYNYISEKGSLSATLEFVNQTPDWLRQLGPENTSYYLPELVFLGPLIMFQFRKIDRIKNKIIQNIAGSYVLATMLYFVFWASLEAVVNKNFNGLLVFFLTAFLIGSVAGRQKGLFERYSVRNFAKGFTTRDVFKEDVDQNDADRTLLFVISILVIGYWFNVTVSPDQLNLLYTLLFTGLLAVVGFTALLFTFAHDRISLASVKRNIASDTNNTYRSVGRALLVLIFSFLFFSQQEIVFTLQKQSVYNQIAIYFLLVSLALSLADIETTFNLFQRVVAVMASRASNRGGVRIVFEERNTPEHLGATSLSSEGFSGLRVHLEDVGYNATVVEKLSLDGLAGLANSIIIFQRFSMEMQDSDCAIFKKFVENGGAIVIITDANDVDTKKNLLSEFGIKTLPFSYPKLPFTGIDLSQLLVSDSESFDFTGFGDGHLIAKQPVEFEITENVSELIPTNIAHLERNDRRQALGVFVNIGEGTVVCLGTLSPWTNRNVSTAQHTSCFDRILDHIQVAQASKSSSVDKTISNV